MSVLAIVGATGVGKSRLSIQLAKHLNAEIINADVLQMYRGLNIATNKLSSEEMEGIQHHLIDFVDPTNEYTVLDFVRDSVKCIDDIHSRGKIPILVGGSHYYIQSLLFRNSLVGNESDLDRVETCSAIDVKELRLALTNPLTTSEQLHSMLRKVDPVMANRWHQNDIRKIKRSLEVFIKTGGNRRYSEIIQQQKPLESRYRSLIFWLHSDWQELMPKLNDRIDSMIQAGLFSELNELDRQFNESAKKSKAAAREPLDYSRGILQAIGFKEFREYRAAQLDSLVESSTLLEISIQKMKTATRRYAKRQVNWIRKKLLPACSDQATSHLYLLDASVAGKWSANVQNPATQLSGIFLSGSDRRLPNPTSLSAAANTYLSVTPSQSAVAFEQFGKRVCDVCLKTLQGENEWKQHLQSRYHRKAVKMRNSPEQWEHYQRAKTKL